MVIEKYSGKLKSKGVIDMIAFGPVPSRRLGQSLGINNIPPKICSYACVYCQLGRTIKMRLKRQAYDPPQNIFQEVHQKIEKLRQCRQQIDYLTFVPDGEPALDVNLGRGIELLRELEIPIAVITNSSLIWRKDVREELLQADWVSVKVDTVTETTWRKVNRPYHALHLETILEGIGAFADQFKGVLATETMLIKKLNDDPEELEQISEFLAQIEPFVAYLAIPTRPPAESYAVAPAEEKINQAYNILKNKIERVELLIGYEGNLFAFTGKVEDDLLSITAVHPMRADAVDSLLKRSQSDWSTVDRMVQEEKLLETTFEGKKFYMRRLDRLKKYR
jgi:wyosine [tRNA(Phe)-imidazoG37] synthetase (radical SAM superfamily)